MDMLANANLKSNPQLTASDVVAPPNLSVTHDTRHVTNPLDKSALWALLAQHLSSTWGDRCSEFAVYLYLITFFPDTLLPASLFGFFTTGTGILFSGLVGNLVDKYPRLPFVRICIAAQKLSASLAYACFLVLFLHLRQHQDAIVWVVFALITLCGSMLKLSTVAISVAIERDWVMTIAQDDSDKLTRLNTYLRRIDLMSKLVAPLFVSLLTSVASYIFSMAFLCGLGLATMIFELLWINVVYGRFSALNDGKEPSRRQNPLNVQVPPDRGRRLNVYQSSLRHTKLALKTSLADWHTFVHSPVFPSSLAISLLYLTVLSFDGTLLSWLKTHDFSDPFVAGMRGICVFSGLLGTLVMPWLEKRIGLIRAGTWSIMSEVLSLIPVLLSFYIGSPQEGKRGPAWNTAMLFSGMALSRIGLWAFDLCQLKELQTTLASHPRRNSITALQFSLQNTADLCKYVLTIVLYHPSQFKYAALVSFIAVCLGAASYLVYSKRERGHIWHLDWIEELLQKVK